MASTRLRVPLFRSTLSRHWPQTSYSLVYPKPTAAPPTSHSALASSPATTSPDLPEYEEPPPPDFLSAGAQHLYLQGIDYLHSQECLYHSNLKPEDWLAAYGAIIVPDFTEQILGALLDSSVVSEFPTEIVEPLANRHDTTHVFNYLHGTLSAQQSFTSSAKLTKHKLDGASFSCGVWGLDTFGSPPFLPRVGSGWALLLEHEQLCCCHTPETLPFPRLKGFQFHVKCQTYKTQADGASFSCGVWGLDTFGSPPFLPAPLTPPSL